MAGTRIGAEVGELGSDDVLVFGLKGERQGQVAESGGRFLIGAFGQNPIENGRQGGVFHFAPRFGDDREFGFAMHLQELGHSLDGKSQGQVVGVDGGGAVKVQVVPFADDCDKEGEGRPVEPSP